MLFVLACVRVFLSQLDRRLDLAVDDPDLFGACHQLQCLSKKRFRRLQRVEVRSVEPGDRNPRRRQRIGNRHALLFGNLAGHGLEAVFNLHESGQQQRLRLREHLSFRLRHSTRACVQVSSGLKKGLLLFLAFLQILRRSGGLAVEVYQHLGLDALERFANGTARGGFPPVEELQPVAGLGDLMLDSVLDFQIGDEGLEGGSL